MAVLHRPSAPISKSELFPFAQLMAPEAGLLTTRMIVTSQNALYNLFRMGLNACDDGMGPFFTRGTKQYYTSGGTLRRQRICGNDGEFSSSS